jgi:hypothetical protein
MVLIWNGLEFEDVEHAEAERLIKEDKAQLADGLEGTAYKERAEFAGYDSDYKTKVSKPKKKVKKAKTDETPDED